MKGHFSASIGAWGAEWEDGGPILLGLAGEYRGEVWLEEAGDAQPADSPPRVLKRRYLKKLADSFEQFLRSLLPLLAGKSLAGVTIGIQSAGTWTLVLIRTSSDEAVIVLGEAFGLGEIEVVGGVGRWWRRVTAERDQGALRVVVAGPHHLGLPPRDVVGRAQ